MVTTVLGSADLSQIGLLSDALGDTTSDPILLPPPPPRIMSYAEFLALPDDPTVRRELVNGTVLEEPRMPTNLLHAIIVARITGLLFRWAETQGPEWTDRVVSGEAGFRLGGESLVGLDVAVAPPGSIDENYCQGTPVVAIEVISPNDTVVKLHDRVELFLAAGVAQVWLVWPWPGKVEIFRPGQEVETYVRRQSFSGDPDLPGLTLRVADLFPAAVAPRSTSASTGTSEPIGSTEPAATPAPGPTSA